MVRRFFVRTGVCPVEKDKVQELTEKCALPLPVKAMNGHQLEAGQLRMETLRVAQKALRFQESCKLQFQRSQSRTDALPFYSEVRTALQKWLVEFGSVESRLAIVKMLQVWEK